MLIRDGLTLVLRPSLRLPPFGPLPGTCRNSTPCASPQGTACRTPHRALCPAAALPSTPVPIRDFREVRNSQNICTSCLSTIYPAYITRRNPAAGNRIRCHSWRNTPPNAGFPGARRLSVNGVSASCRPSFPSAFFRLHSSNTACPPRSQKMPAWWGAVTAQGFPSHAGESR